ncbi:flagellar biosynthesis protein FlgJ [Mariprofundus erugo]|uniref:Flagellar biosynthesis protein FlgJ n=1 Tax=Mariprofundus erugo TaxID=2528639 RepID=A0A5R9GRB4_9PROT|nr:glucosaminidase domain-containing protein [Mariprofundus erugo]TLS66963.1 flagellar biosynthesis protein FlgJ [Mariprofundus erugo]
MKTFNLTSIFLLASLLLSGCSVDHFSLFQSDAPAPVQVDHQKPASTHGDVSARKAAFFASMKPVVMRENNRIRELREELYAIRALRHPGKAKLKLVARVARDYQLELNGEPDAAFWQELLVRVDEVPLEMALVQAANESAWGSSRFAREGNNYFGQWCFKKGCGLVPNQRAADATHEVRRFAGVDESVRAYMYNINTSGAYAEFRSIRHSLRVQSRPLDAESLVYGLRSYSELGMTYVEMIRSMIRSNRELIANS